MSTSGFWVVPPGVHQINIVFKGAQGGGGGNASGPYTTFYGGSGGLAANFTITTAVTSGDTIRFNLGSNGLDGASDIGNWIGYYRHGGNGTSGGNSSLIIAGNLIFSMSGGSNGTGACGGCQNGGINGSPGQNGQVTLHNFNDNGVLVYSKDDIFGIPPSSILIRF
jgi:hypothetical protein